MGNELDTLANVANKKDLERITTEKLLSRPMYGNLFASARGEDFPFEIPDDPLQMVDAFHAGFAVTHSGDISSVHGLACTESDSDSFALGSITGNGPVSSTPAPPLIGQLVSSTFIPEETAYPNITSSTSPSSPKSLERSKGIRGKINKDGLRSAPLGRSISNLLMEEFGEEQFIVADEEPASIVDHPEMVSKDLYDQAIGKSDILSKVPSSKGVDAMYMEIAEQLAESQAENRQLQKRLRSFSVSNSFDNSAQDSWKKGWVNRLQTRLVFIELAIQGLKSGNTERSVLEKEREQILAMKISLQEGLVRTPPVNGEVKAQLIQTTLAANTAMQELSNAKSEWAKDKERDSSSISALKLQIQQLEIDLRSATLANYQTGDLNAESRKECVLLQAAHSSMIEEKKVMTAENLKAHLEHDRQIQELTKEMVELSRVLGEAQEHAETFEHQMEQFKNELDQRLLTGNEESKKALHESLKMIEQLEKDKTSYRQKNWNLAKELEDNAHQSRIKLEEEIQAQEELKKQLDLLAETIEDLQKQVVKLREEKKLTIIEGEKKVSQVQTILERVKGECSSSNDLLSSEKVHSESLEKRMKAAEEREQSALDRIAGLMRAAFDTNSRQESSTSLQEELVTAQRDTERLVISLMASEKKLEIANHEVKELKGAASRVIELEKRLSSLANQAKDDVEQLGIEKLELADRIASLEMDLRQGKKEMAIAKSSFERLALESDAQVSKMKKLFEISSSSSSPEENMKKKNIELSEKVNELKLQLEELNHRYKIEMANVKVLKKTLDDVSNSSWW
jgi:hypothetical protein